MRGEGHSRARSCSGRRDHPRMRGEDRDVWESTAMDLGSPPHARGRLLRRREHRSSRRITPACAGKTRDAKANHLFEPDHPRMRGEDGNYAEYLTASDGSPPHARGRRRRRRRDPGEGVITPACAGKTRPEYVSRNRPPDHPRMRGEDQGPRTRPCLVFGSPPHARGRLHLSKPLIDLKGITPACAGKTMTPCLFRWLTRDHPRMRGEDAS